MEIQNSSSIHAITIKRSLRYKILFFVLPLFLISFVFFGITTYFSINRSITNIAKEFIGYKLKEISEYTQSLSIPKTITQDIKNDFVNNILSYSKKFNQEIVVIIPYNYEEIKDSDIKYALDDQNITAETIEKIYQIVYKQDTIKEINIQNYNSWITFQVDKNKEYVGIFIPNIELQSWIVLLADANQFYAPVVETMIVLIIIVIISLLLMSILVLFFVNFLTNPITYCVDTIKKITDSMDFSKRVRIFYPDEIGILGQYFNNLVQELEKSYNQIKNYAYQTVMAKKKEERIRFIFQKYVPSDVIDQVLSRSTNTMLIGVKQQVSVLFSDIRDFTTISEQLPPEKLVLSLNDYFTVMVHQVIHNKGIIDKFIGDAIMAIFGAPVVCENNSDQAIDTALQMVTALHTFNAKQKETNKITFQMGIGINTGEAIVGNIGSDQKIEYTVIGDTVNLGSRLEGLTKYYQVSILISEFTKNNIQNSEKYMFINIDKVKVKGKESAVEIYTVKLFETISEEEMSFYNKYHLAQMDYYAGKFDKAYEQFTNLKSNPYFSYLIDLYLKRCLYLQNNLPLEWDGVEAWDIK